MGRTNQVVAGDPNSNEEKRRVSLARGSDMIYSIKVKCMHVPSYLPLYLTLGVR